MHKDINLLIYVPIYPNRYVWFGYRLIRNLTKRGADCIRQPSPHEPEFTFAFQPQSRDNGAEQKCDLGRDQQLARVVSPCVDTCPGGSLVIYFYLENLVLWARSETMGCAMKIIQSVK